MEQCRQLDIVVESGGAMQQPHTRDDSDLRSSLSNAPLALPKVCSQSHPFRARNLVAFLPAFQHLSYHVEVIQVTRLLTSCCGPQGWEQRCDPNTGTFFYIDHNTRRTCWEVRPEPGHWRMLATTLRCLST